MVKPRKVKLSNDFLKKVRSVKSKRAKIVVEHIIKHGSITTDDLSKLGYSHPPRAIRDVRECGIPIKTLKLKNKLGRNIAKYEFGNFNEIKQGRFSGRSALPKELKESLLASNGNQCAICSTKLHSRYLQVDHCIPFEIAGESKELSSPNDFMLLCASCNRAKSWSCEHCKNWKEKSPEKCLTCYWASPMNYQHIAYSPLRRLDVTWTDSEIQEYEKMVELAKHANKKMPDFIKEVLRNQIKNLK